MYPQSGLSEDENGAKEAKSFKKVVRCIEMLAMPLLMWRSFRDLRQNVSDKKIKIKYLECPGLVTTERNTLLSEVTKWTNREGTNYYSLPKKVLSELQSQGGPFTRYFHCELQLLELFMSDDMRKKDVYSYVGVSKLSCQFCSTIYENQSRFRTKGGHHQISANCAFLMKPGELGRFCFMYGALVAEETYMMRRLDTHRSGADVLWSKYPNLEQTFPSRYLSQVEPQTDAKTEEGLTSAENSKSHEPDVPESRYVRAIKLGKNGSFDQHTVKLVEVPYVDRMYYHIHIYEKGLKNAILVPDFQFQSEGPKHPNSPHWIATKLWTEETIE